MNKFITHFQLLIVLLTVSLLAAADNHLLAKDHPVTVPITSSLVEDASKSSHMNVPILVMFSSDDCSYCRIVEEQFLIPMIISGEYENKVIIRVVKVNSSDDMQDFKGKTIAMDDFADREGVSFTPTIKFYGPEGKELVPQMIGLTTVDYYGGFLDEAIDSSLNKLKQHRQNTEH